MQAALESGRLLYLSYAILFQPSQEIRIDFLPIDLI